MILKYLIKGLVIIKLTNNCKELFMNPPNNFKKSSFYFLYVIIYF